MRKKSKEIGVKFASIGSDALMIRSFDDGSEMTFAAAGLTGLLLKSISTDTVLFNGSLILAKEAGELVPIVPATPLSTEIPGR